jgi:hypothetical protein
VAGDYGTREHGAASDFIRDVAAGDDISAPQLLMNQAAHESSDVVLFGLIFRISAGFCMFFFACLVVRVEELVC